MLSKWRRVLGQVAEDRLADPARIDVVEEKVQLRDYPDVGAALPVDRYQRLDVRLRLRIEPTLTSLHPRLKWLVIDGYGFHEGYFHWRCCVETQAIPVKLTAYAHRAFDQGLGRSLWFVDGADAKRISATIAAFPPSRHADLWSGVGLACAYAAGAEQAALEALKTAARVYRSHLAQGAAFAAKARQRAGNPSPHTEIACNILCGLSADAAAHLCDMAFKDLPPDGAEPAYEVWRQRIRAQFAGGME